MPDGTQTTEAPKVETPPIEAPKVEAPKVEAKTASWPDNWKDLVSADEKHRKTLDRFDSPKAMFESYVSLRQQRDSGELKRVTPFPDKGTPEEQTQWRVENGVPEAPDKYDLKFDNGLVIGDDDKPMIEDFLKHAHAKNIPTAAAKAAVEWYFKSQTEKARLADEAFDKQKQETADALRSEWGGDYHRNNNVVGGLLDSYVQDDELKGLIKRAVETHPGYARFMARVALEINPQPTVVGAGPSNEASISDELGKLKSMMGNRASEYWKGPNAEKNQARFRELTEWMERQKK